MNSNQHLVAEVVSGIRVTALGETAWHVVDETVLEVSHKDALTGDVTISHYRLVPVEKRYVETPAVTS